MAFGEGFFTHSFETGNIMDREGHSAGVGVWLIDRALFSIFPIEQIPSLMPKTEIGALYAPSSRLLFIDIPLSTSY